MLAWLRGHETAIWWIAWASILTFLAFLVLVPLLVIRLPSDYFTRRRIHRKLWADQPLAIRRVLQVGKNFVGGVFIVAGMIMQISFTLLSA
jgi:hypothetical protein